MPKNQEQSSLSRKLIVLIKKRVYKNKYTKKNFWRNIADEFDMSPEGAERSQGYSPFFPPAITAIIWKPADRLDRWDRQDR